jgi:iron complex outermembrane receptor protein
MTDSSRRRFGRSAASALAVASLGSSAAFAQTASPTALEEVVVTASKRAENIQTVPSSVSVLGAEEFKRHTGSVDFDPARHRAVGR